jgi:phosphatidylglycerol:prolipoprotein diacylglycerol transferase
VVTNWFDSGSGDTPYVATVRLTGRRLGVIGPARAEDTFIREETIQAVVPNTGRVSLTSWVYGIAAGEWDVRAELVRGLDHPARAVLGSRARPQPPETLPRGKWSWFRWQIATADDAPIKTRMALLAPLARIPAVAPGSWTALGVIGVSLAVALLAAIASGRGITIGQSLLTSLLAVAAGLAGAKVWFAVLAPGPWYRALARGWAVDGFLVVAPIAAIGLLLVQGLPVGIYLDASAPGIFFAVAIGRVGCFFTGCCAGRMTRGRIGIWSSDRRVGARRVPAQLFESGAGLAIALVSTALVLLRLPLPDGVIFVLAFTTYAVVRQVMLRIRAEARTFSWRRGDTLAARS